MLFEYFSCAGRSFMLTATRQDFFQKFGSVTFVPLWCPNFMQKLEKTNKQSLRYLKTE